MLFWLNSFSCITCWSKTWSSRRLQLATTVCDPACFVLGWGLRLFPKYLWKCFFPHVQSCTSKSTLLWILWIEGALGSIWHLHPCLWSWSCWSVSILLQAPVSCTCQVSLANSCTFNVHLFLGEWTCHQILCLLALVNSSATRSKVH